MQVTKGWLTLCNIVQFPAVPSFPAANIISWARLELFKFLLLDCISALLELLCFPLVPLELVISWETSNTTYHIGAVPDAGPILAAALRSVCKQARTLARRGVDKVK
jgi:hypothetical protein